MAAAASESKKAPLSSKDGNSKVVPLGGQKVPKGMEAHADWMKLPVVEPPKKQSYGKACDALIAERERFVELKKAIAKVGPPIGAMLSTDREKQPKAFAKQKSLRDKAVAELKAIAANWPEGSEEAGMAKAIVDGSGAEFKSKEQHHKFQTVCQRATQSIFRKCRDLLQKIKVEKKKFLDAKKKGENDDEDEE